MTDDRAERRRALDPSASFAVRAPAGSGKTSLLTQRVLRLLATVEHPEQIVAITFTRKAAEEMRSRILDALDPQATQDEPLDDYQRELQTLAAAARAQDAARDWRLAEQPARLRITTIDALNQRLVRRMPVTAGLPGHPRVEQDAPALYREAARRALAGITDPGRPIVRQALQHLDNNWSGLEDMVAALLGKRDRWLPLLGHGLDREFCEHSFEQHVGLRLSECAARLTPDLRQQILQLCIHAGSNMDDSALRDLQSFPAADYAHLAQWREVIGLFLTGKGPYSWRKTVNKNQGFPAGAGRNKEMKALWSDVAEALQNIDGLHRCFELAQYLPLRVFEPGDFEIAQAFAQLLLTATAHLQVMRDVDGRADYVTFALAARQALGTPEQPTDLTLSLDYQIRHLLVDEFQDTSETQLGLIETLVSGWEPGDGRTLFVVGDPMQSIYRFRDANVELFNTVFARGRIGDVPLEGLTLRSNFRSQADLVAWINMALPDAMRVINTDPRHFVAQQAVRAGQGNPVVLHALETMDADAEARSLVEAVLATQRADPNASLAILVRARSHLGPISSKLQEHGVPLAAREIKPFTSLPVVSDLLALARALLHPADRAAWLAVLRAPWCGLTLNSLKVLADDADTFAHAVGDEFLLARLEPGEQVRARSLSGVMTGAQERLSGRPFSEVLEETWLTLRGPALVADPGELDDARLCLDEIAAFEREGRPMTADGLESRFNGRYASGRGDAAGAVQVMTMHAAKGLEFDHVFLPGLGRTASGGTGELMLWRTEGGFGALRALLMAPRPARDAQTLYRYLKFCDKLEEEAESTRVIYVALTRARRHLHLFGCAERNHAGDFVPRKGSLLQLLWPRMQSAFAQCATEPDAGAEPPEATVVKAELRRVALTHLPAAVPRAPAAIELREEIPFDWAGLVARHVGTVAHRVLQELGRGTGWGLDEAVLARLELFARGQLRALGVSAEHLATAVQTVMQVVRNVSQSERGRWLFDRSHTDVAVELCLGTVGTQGVQRLVLDRTFVDSAGQRWIIDFKTGSHSGGGREAWLDSELERYRPQLERYAHALAAGEQRPIRLGLYFPLLDAWREWAHEAAG